MIPECETECDIHSENFVPSWLSYSTPYKNDRPEKCLRFESAIRENNSNAEMKETCTENSFVRSHVVSCDRLVVKNSEERLISRVRR